MIPRGADFDTEKAPSLANAGGGAFVRYGGRDLLSSRDPARLPERAAAAFAPIERGLVLVPSPLLGYGLEALAAKLPPGSAILCVESDPALAALCAPRLDEVLARLGGKAAFVASRSWPEILAAAERLGVFRRCDELALSGGRAIDPGFYDGVRSALVEWIGTRWKNKSTLWAMGRLWTRNIFRNLAFFPDLAPLPDFGSRPALVCGAGPSLERALPFLRERRERLPVVIACDTAVQSLIRSGVRPDLIVCLEAQAYNLPDLYCVAGSGVPVVADLSSHPETLRATGGRVSLVASEFADSSFLRAALASGLPILPVPPLGSVGVLALHLAFLLTRGAVYVSGLDFSYPSGKTHARGSPQLDLAYSSRLSVASRHWAASLQPRSQALSGGFRSDPALSGYAAVARSIVMPHAQRCVDLRGSAPQALGAGRALDPSSLRLEDFAARETAPEPPLDADAARAYREAASGLVARERENLGRLAGLFRGLRTSGGDEAARQALSGELAARLGASDYLYYHFPDSERAVSRDGSPLPEDILKRLLLEREYWAAYLDRIAGQA